VSDHYARNVNITNVHVTNINVRNVNVTNIQYVNERVAGGVTAVPRRSFEGAQPIGRIATVVSPRDALTGTVVGHTAQVAPTIASRLGRAPDNARLTVRPPEQALSRPVVTRTVDPHTVARAPVTSIRPEPARVPVTITRPATPANETHIVRAAPVAVKPAVKNAPVVARPVETQPMMRAQPAVRAEQPVARPAPATRVQPVLHSEEATRARPVMHALPAVNATPVRTKVAAPRAPVAAPTRVEHVAQSREPSNTVKVDRTKDARRRPVKQP
jgi:hypothetical protein